MENEDRIFQFYIPQSNVLSQIWVNFVQSYGRVGKDWNYVTLKNNLNRDYGGLIDEKNYSIIFPSIEEKTQFILAWSD